MLFLCTEADQLSGKIYIYFNCAEVTSLGAIEEGFYGHLFLCTSTLKNNDKKMLEKQHGTITVHSLRILHIGFL